MRGMASKSIFESKYGSRERRATRQNIAENLNKCEEFVLEIDLLPSWKGTS